MSSKIVDLPRFNTGNGRHDAWNRLQVINNLVQSGRRLVADSYLKSFTEAEQEGMANTLIAIHDKGYEAVHRSVVVSIH